MPSSLLQVVNSLIQTCYNNWEQAVRRQLVDNLFADLIVTTTCAFYVCTQDTVQALYCGTDTQKSHIL